MAEFFLRRLAELRESAANMAALCEKALDKSQRAYFDRNSTLAKEVMTGDEQINMLELEVDSNALSLLALDHPMAGDLRNIVGTLNIGLDLERIGDETYNVARRALFLNNRPPLPYFPAMENLSQLAMEMLSGAISGYLNGDHDLALNVCRMEERAHVESVKVVKAVIDYMVGEAPAVERCVHTIFITRSLERVASLSANIAESVIFITKGVNVKAGCSE